MLITTIYNGLCAFVKKLPRTPKTVIIVAMIAALNLVFRRNVYLPFLGETVYPCDNLTEKTPDGADLSVKVTDVPANVKVVYWAAEPSTTIIGNPWDAYGKYENSGVVISDANGTATLSIRKPAGYKVPSGRKLNPHVHYRFCQESGILSSIRTATI